MVLNKELALWISPQMDREERSLLALKRAFVRQQQAVLAERLVLPNSDDIRFAGADTLVLIRARNKQHRDRIPVHYA
jgi:hypothetical protein